MASLGCAHHPVFEHEAGCIPQLTVPVKVGGIAHLTTRAAVLQGEFDAVSMHTVHGQHCLASTGPELWEGQGAWELPGARDSSSRCSITVSDQSVLRYDRKRSVVHYYAGDPSNREPQISHCERFFNILSRIQCFLDINLSCPVFGKPSSVK